MEGEGLEEDVVGQSPFVQEGAVGHRNKATDTNRGKKGRGAERRVKNQNKPKDG